MQPSSHPLSNIGSLGVRPLPTVASSMGIDTVQVDTNTPSVDAERLGRLCDGDESSIAHVLCHFIDCGSMSEPQLINTHSRVNSRLYYDPPCPSTAKIACCIDFQTRHDPTKKFVIQSYKIVEVLHLRFYYKINFNGI